MDHDAEEATKLADEIHETIEEVADWKKEKHAAYFESVEQTTKDIIATVEENDGATDSQVNALRNMLDGVKKWVN